MEHGSLGLFLGLRTPQLPATHAKAGTVLAHWTGHYIFDVSRTSFDEYHYSHATSCRTTWLSHEEYVGVKCLVNRGCASSHRLTIGCLWVP
jgi:hypothetical protein